MNFYEYQASKKIAHNKVTCNSTGKKRIPTHQTNKNVEIHKPWKDKLDHLLGIKRPWMLFFPLNWTSVKFDPPETSGVPAKSSPLILMKTDFLPLEVSSQLRDTVQCHGGQYIRHYLTVQSIHHWKKLGHNDDQILIGKRLLSFQTSD